MAKELSERGKTAETISIVPVVPKDCYTKIETEDNVNNWYKGAYESFLLALCRDTLTEEQYKNTYLIVLNFNAYKPDYVKQEIWAKLLAYNITEILVTHTVIKK